MVEVHCFDAVYLVDWPVTQTDTCSPCLLAQVEDLQL